MNLANKNDRRERRKQRVRKKVFGSQERPRLTVFRSLGHIYAQIIDDTTASTLVSASTLDREIRSSRVTQPKSEMSKQVGALLAKRASEKNITKVAFDRNGLIYHGRVKALADAAREAGLEF